MSQYLTKYAYKVQYNTPLYARGRNFGQLWVLVCWEEPGEDQLQQGIGSETPASFLHTQVLIAKGKQRGNRNIVSWALGRERGPQPSTANYLFERKKKLYIPS
jgi:hypothetical protein